MDAETARDYTTPTLLRAARGAYARSVRASLLAEGIDNLPRNGAFVLMGISARAGGPRPDLPFELGVTKQAVSLIVDALVSRGYLGRAPDPADRRRISLELTERGRRAVDAVAEGVAAVDSQLRELIPAGQIEAMRAGLLALAQIRAGEQATEAPGPPGPRCRGIAPIFPVRDLAAALAHYTALGFIASAYEDGDGYGFARRDHLGLHLNAIGEHPHDDGGDPDHDHGDEHEHGDGHGNHFHCAAAYLYVTDADALHEEWSRPGIGGHTGPVHAMEYGLREGTHTDPDGNLIRFGSPIPD